MLNKWEVIPTEIKNPSILPYYNYLCSKKIALTFKRCFDLIVAIILLTFLSPIFILISFAVALDSQGPIIFKQVRITQYGREFYILKFRTMVVNAESIGTQVTTKNDPRITRIGLFLRKFRLDEFPQLFNIISGDMTFVGTRPEVPKYVKVYSDEMKATLLLPAGITSEASIFYKDEEKLLASAKDADKFYIETILPEKMKFNLQSIKSFSIFRDLQIILKTVSAVIQ